MRLGALSFVESVTQSPQHAVISDDFRVEHLLRRGSTTDVWLARLPGGLPCVVKTAAPDYIRHRGVGRLIEREWEFLHAAAQPGVVAALGLCESSAGAALVTEYLPGGDVVALVGSHPRHWAPALAEVAHALIDLHDRALAHRDVKPRNVLLDKGGRARLIDFASAGYFGATCPSGGLTAAYRNPRAAESGVASAAEDCFAFAAMVYELLAAQLPFGLAPSRDGELAPLDARCRHGQVRGVAALAAHTMAVLSEPGQLPEPRSALAVFATTLGAIMADSRA